MRYSLDHMQKFDETKVRALHLQLIQSPNGILSVVTRRRKMVEKFKTILNKMKADQGSVGLFALLKMDELTDRWTVLLSADWAKEGDSQTFKYLHDLIRENITVEEMATIARFGIFARSNHLVELLMKYKSNSRIIEEKVNGNVIHDGYILASGEIVDVIEVVPL